MWIGVSLFRFRSPHVNAIIRKRVSGMRDIYYADNRDLIKWGVLLRLAEMFDAARIVHVAYYRESQFGPLIIDGQEFDVPQSVLAHFRNLRTIAAIQSDVRVTVFDSVFQDRAAYLQSVQTIQSAFPQERCIVFLDPDTGLEPGHPGLEHVLGPEAAAIWTQMKSGDVFVFYQHRSRKPPAGQDWFEPKRLQLAEAIGVPLDTLKVATAPAIAPDVAFYFAQRAEQGEAPEGRAAKLSE